VRKPSGPSGLAVSHDCSVDAYAFLEENMQAIGSLLATHPRRPPDTSLIEACAAACYDCGSVCVACSDACLGEARVADLVCCIRTCLDCSDVCLATGRVVSRLTEPCPMLIEAQLMACAEACRICAAECEHHAAMHEHCLVCANACRACEQACRALLHGASLA
jgi:hypothetical protein